MSSNSDLLADAQLAQLASALLRREVPEWPYAADQTHQQRFLDYVAFHGIEALLHEVLRTAKQWPQTLVETLQQRVTLQAMRELRERDRLQLVCAKLAAAGIEGLLFKGAALAYSLYANPVWRSRSDCDLFVAESQLQHALVELQALGYQRNGTDMGGYQMELVWTAAEGGTHHIDLHWKLNNSSVLAKLFSFDELWQRRVALPLLSGSANAPCNADALIIACLHRGVHQLASYTVNNITALTGERWIWLLDIDLLARALTATEWQQFYQLANAKGLAGCCGDTLALAAQYLASPLPPGWQQQLQRQGWGSGDHFLAGGPFQRGWQDLAACPGWQAKAAYLRSLLFPPAVYMREKFSGARWGWLPWLYVRRMFGGLLKRLIWGWNRQ